VIKVDGEPIIGSHPDLDCVFLNAGIQYVMDISKTHTVDMKRIVNEITVNYVSMVALTHAFIPFFQANSIGKDIASI
jgi:short-subunit dehydrogenase involved in D-alanine esterification of teichoic acids